MHQELKSSTTVLPVITIGGRRVAVDLPHFAFATAIAAWCVWYGIDAFHAQKTVANLIMIVPTTIGALILYLVVAAGCFRRLEPAEERPPSHRRPIERSIAIKIAGTMAMLAAFVVIGPTVGFDVACFFYIGGMLLFLGERRILVLIVVPIVFCVLAIYCFSQVLYTPLPLFFLGGDN